ncbi:hypothetical protein [Tunturiibacter lichenicola]|uniref:hypothetical protein n=1 Tax=Tunturiibacter lichenicola TaxID=2051959 RepID=UPI0021B2E8FD|nr:hypothetical protein [Edaphobacter lichenicola]
MERRNVYVVGAGFSVGLGFPMTTNLLVDVWDRLTREVRENLAKVISFHNPGFRPARRTTFPYIEDLLTQIAVNLEMFDSSRTTTGNFTKADLIDAREELLTEIAKWFHELFQESGEPEWLKRFAERVIREKAVVVSFNWDLILDEMLFGGDVAPENYGLGKASEGPILLKPHGSLNWYEEDQIAKVAEEKRVTLHKRTKEYPAVQAFVHPRHIVSKTGRRYTPLIVPPQYLKDFSRPISKSVWRSCVEALSVAPEVFFLGYSLPGSDLQAQFIMRCGFYNQSEGLPASPKRKGATGPARVCIVNPDRASAQRIEGVLRSGQKCVWEPQKVEEWV